MAARESTEFSPVLARTPFKDLRNSIRTKFKERIATQWRVCQNSKLREVKALPGRCDFVRGMKRDEAIKLLRLRSGHTKMSHVYLFERQPQPECPYCHQSSLSVRHIFLECLALNDQRDAHNIRGMENLSGLREGFEGVINFCRDVELWKEI